MRLFKSIACGAVLSICLAPGARADEWNKQTFLTFSGPVQIPGATLPAGTYQFKLADLTGNRHVVQVMDKDGTKIFGTFLTIPVESRIVPEKPVIMFSERPAGQPQAVRIWYYPGDTIGDEFVYPKSQAMRIARESHASVLSMADNTNATTVDKNTVNGTDRGLYSSAKVERIDESGNVTTDRQATDTAKASTPATANSTAATGTSATAPAQRDRDRAQSTAQAETPRATTAQADAARAATPSPNAAATPRGTTGQTNAAPNAQRRNARSLPRTASQLAVVELLTGLAFAGVLGVRQLRKRIGEVR